MSEDERPKMTAQDEAGDEVEAHRAPKLDGKMDATDEAVDTDGDDDFEAHRGPHVDRPGKI